ncbi:MAG TPA: hypothetical protein VGJ28_01670 [Micromonosporaceae bacterium]|jgi:hypothetical protein
MTVTAPARRLPVAACALVLATSAAALSAAPAQAATAMPAHVYAPYFETWTTDSITTAAQQSGSRYFTLAFLEVPSKGSCTPAWNGDATQTMSSGRYVSDIASLRAMGGDVGTLSTWAVQRDNGGCPGGRDKNDCSGIAQNPWDFSAVLNPYTG